MRKTQPPIVEVCYDFQMETKRDHSRTYWGLVSEYLAKITGGFIAGCFLILFMHLFGFTNEEIKESMRESKKNVSTIDSVLNSSNQLLTTAQLRSYKTTFSTELFDKIIAGGYNQNKTPNEQDLSNRTKLVETKVDLLQGQVQQLLAIQEKPWWQDPHIIWLAVAFWLIQMIGNHVVGDIIAILWHKTKQSIGLPNRERKKICVTGFSQVS